MFLSKLYFRSHALHHQGELSNFFHIKSILFSVFAMLSSFRTLLLPCCAYLLRRTLLQFVDLDVELLSSACHTNLLGPFLTCYNILWSSCYGVNITTRTFLARIAHYSAGDQNGTECSFSELLCLSWITP